MAKILRFLTVHGARESLRADLVVRISENQEKKVSLHVASPTGQGFVSVPCGETFEQIEPRWLDALGVEASTPAPDETVGVEPVEPDDKDDTDELETPIAPL